MQNVASLSEKGLFTFYKQEYDFLEPPRYDQDSKKQSQVTQSGKKKRKSKMVKNNSVKKISPQKTNECQSKKLSIEKKIKRKTLKRSNSKKLLTKKLIKSNLTSSLKYEGQDSKSRMSQIKEQEKTVNFEKKLFISSETIKVENSVSLQLGKRSPQPTRHKKAIISETNLIPKPFGRYLQKEEDEYESDIFGSLCQYLKNPETNIHKNKSQISSLNKSELNHFDKNKIAVKFLQKIVRKNINQQNNCGQNQPQNKRNQMHLSQFNSEQAIRTLNKEDLQKISPFRNGHLLNFFDKNRSAALQTHQNQLQQVLIKSGKMEKQKLLRIKTEPLHYLQKVSDLQKKSSDSKQLINPNDVNQKFQQKNLIESKNDYKRQIFLPSYNTSLGLHQTPKKQNSLQNFLTYELVHQCYKDMKSKSRKLLKFSMSKNQNTSCLENNDCEQNDRLKSLNNSGLQQNTFVRRKDSMKLPMIANVFSFKQKNVIKSETKLIMVKGLTQNQKQRKSNLSKNSRQMSNKYHSKSIKDNMKDRLRCYTQSEGKFNTEDLKSKISNNLSEFTKKVTQTNSREEAKIEESLSAKIIQSFHERYYKKYDQQSSRNQRVSKLDMSENMMYRWKDSHEWEQKKKQIIKKLGIKI